MIPLIVACAGVVLLGASLVRLLAGPTHYDRLLAANAAFAKIALIVAALGTALQSPDALNVAIAILLGGAVLSTVVFKLFKAKTFQPPLASAREEP